MASHARVETSFFLLASYALDSFFCFQRRPKRQKPKKMRVDEKSGEAVSEKTQREKHREFPSGRNMAGTSFHSCLRLLVFGCLIFYVAVYRKRRGNYLLLELLWPMARNLINSEDPSKLPPIQHTLTLHLRLHCCIFSISCATLDMLQRLHFLSASSLQTNNSLTSI